MRIALAMVFALGFPAAWGATPAAWKSLDIAARASCTNAITRLAAKAKISGVTGTVIGIGAPADTDRFYALILKGKTAGFASQWLCLYDKRAKQATAQEIETR